MLVVTSARAEEKGEKRYDEQFLHVSDSLVIRKYN
jgi:hypothetical protein